MIRRKFYPEEVKLRILEECRQAEPGKVGRILRREKVLWQTYNGWKKQFPQYASPPRAGNGQVDPVAVLKRKLELTQRLLRLNQELNQINQELNAMG
ncbi:MAG: hypothetical protein WCK82_08370 [Bacteroidota bacterium]